MRATTKNPGRSIRVNAKGQVLLFVFLLLLLLTLLGGAIAVMWETGLHSLALQKDSVAAFYCAQAGLERAKDFNALHNGNQDTTLTGNVSGGGTYTVDISPNGQDKGIVSTGRYGSAEREIYLNIPKNSNPNACKTPSDCPPYGNAWGYWRKFGNGWEEQ